jgi:hypothetical protein
LVYIALYLKAKAVFDVGRRIRYTSVCTAIAVPRQLSSFSQTCVCSHEMDEFEMSNLKMRSMRCDSEIFKVPRLVIGYHVTVSLFLYLRISGAELEGKSASNSNSSSGSSWYPCPYTAMPFPCHLPFNGRRDSGGLGNLGGSKYDRGYWSMTRWRLNIVRRWDRGWKTFRKEPLLGLLRSPGE